MEGLARIIIAGQVFVLGVAVALLWFLASVAYGYGRDAGALEGRKAAYQEISDDAGFRYSMCIAVAGSRHGVCDHVKYYRDSIRDAATKFEKGEQN